MSATTELLDKYKETCAIASDNAAALSLKVHRATVSGWRVRGTQAEAAVIARMCEAVGVESLPWLGRVARERSTNEADRRAWSIALKKAGIAAVLAIATAPAMACHFAYSGLLMPIMSAGRTGFRSILRTLARHGSALHGQVLALQD